MNETKILTAFTNGSPPENINQYFEMGGYDALKKALSMNSDDVIKEISSSDLRGRGGAGFPTGMKWKFTRASEGTEKYVVCNADEGEPGTFKDRFLMEKNPHLYIEGLIIAAYAIGASKGYIYIRGEYTTSITNSQKAIDQAMEEGILGENILNSGFNLDIEIKLGAGSYLCGEELTLIESLEGKRGHPRIKPPFPAQKGVFDKPTLVNNVETLANIPHIIKNGSEWFKNLGVEKAHGTKLFTISGDINKPGLYEAELGTDLKTLINDYAGGSKNGENIKSILLGGAAGTFISPDLLDVKMDYDSLSNVNATLGSGAIVVIGENRSMYDMLNSIIKFFKHESCGKCVPCRVGCTQLITIMDKLKDPTLDKDLLTKQLIMEAEFMSRTSLCPLGQSPILPIKSGVKYI